MKDPQADYYVSPEGNDGWSGELPTPNDDDTDGPFASLDRARKAVRTQLERIHDRNITVLIREGEYQLDSTVVFDRSDGGAPGQTVTYAAYPGEEPVFTSGRPLCDWRKVPERGEPETVSEAASGNLWAADVEHVREAKRAAGATDSGDDWAFFALYAGEERLPRARGPGFEPVVDLTFSERDRLDEFDRSHIEFPDGAIRNWPRIDDAELRILPTWDWITNLLPVESVDGERGVAKVGVPGTYPLISQIKGFDVDGSSAWIENVLAHLDTPGEWVLDTDEATVYLWPRDGEEPADDIAAPVLREYVRVECDVDYDGPEDDPVRNLAFRGLTFTHGERDRWDPDHLGRGLQHDWDMFDRGNALIRFRGAEDCAVEDCRLVDSASAGIRLDLHCRRVRVADSTLAQLGGTGVLLSGYGPGRKDVNVENEVVNNHVHHCGRDYWHAPGIFITQSGANRVAHNYVHDLHYSGIVVSGIRRLDRTDPQGETQKTVRWHEIGDDREEIPHPDNLPYRHARNNVIEYNEVERIMQRLGDGNGIYLSGAGLGNVVRRNYLHDIESEHCNAVIRTDGWQRGTDIRENVIYRSTGPGVLLKDRNDAIGNVMVDLLPTGGLRDGLFVSLRAGPTNGSRIEHNVYYHSGEEVEFYGANAVGWLPEVDLSAAAANDNVFWWADAPDADWGDQLLDDLREQDIEHDSVFADPLFVDPEAEDFRFQQGSPALEQGAASLDRREMGLYRER